MRLFRFLILLIILAITGYSPASVQAQSFATQRETTVSAAGQTQVNTSYNKLFDEIWQTVNKKFYDPNFAGVDWKAVGERYRPQVAQVADDNAFLILINKMLKELPVSHLSLSLPRRGGQVGIPVNVRTLEGQQIAIGGSPFSEAYRKGLLPGEIIVEPIDSLRGRHGEPVTFNIKGCDGKMRAMEVRRERFTLSKPTARWSIYEPRPGTSIGYLRVLQFDDTIPPQVDAAMEDLKDTRALVIDVRDNPGGNASFIRLSSYFTQGQHLVAALLMRPALERYKSAPAQIDPSTFPKIVGAYTTAEIFKALLSNNGGIGLYSEDLGNKIYRGRVILLINENTGSAAEGFAGYMKLNSKVTLIGTPTAGQLLGGEPIKLSDGWTLFMPTHAAWGPDGKSAIDKSTTPNIEVRMSRQDFCDNRDPILARALEVLDTNQ